MKNILLGLLLTLSILIANEPWFAFTDENDKKELIGFKDKNGIVKIKPKFMSFIIAKQFEHIMAVIEDKNGSYEQYYLLKSGRIVGRDMLYMSDNTPACESEGHIIFQDKNSSFLGMFNAEGEVTIPTQYNSLSPMHNGLVVALKDAKKDYIGDSHNNDGCNHFFFKDGTNYLIDKENTVLIKDFNASLDLNFFSMKITDKPRLEENRENFLGINGKNYSFINYEKEFKYWFFSEFLNDFSKEKLFKNSYKKLRFWSEDNNKWITENKVSFISKNFKVMNFLFKYVQDSNADYSIGSDFISFFNFPELQNYYDTCANFKTWEYPVYSIVISHKKGFSSRESFSFIKMKDGYKLIDVNLKI
jgi:hypothetical protein